MNPFVCIFWFCLSHSTGKKTTRKARDKLHKQIEELKRELKHQKDQKEKYKKKDSSEQTRIKTLPGPKSVSCWRIVLWTASLWKLCCIMKPLFVTLGGSTRMPEMKKKKMCCRGCCSEDSQEIQAAEVVWESTGFSKKSRTSCKNEDLSNNSSRQAYNRYTDESLVSKVKTFFWRDDVSRMTTGKKQIKTMKKIKMQKRFLIDTLKNLHRRFLSNFLRLILPAATLLGCPPLTFQLRHMPVQVTWKPGLSAWQALSA